MDLTAGPDCYYFAMRDLPGDANTSELVVLSYAAASAAFAGSGTRAVVRLYGDFDPVLYDSTSISGNPRFLNATTSGRFAQIGTTYDTWWWDDIGEPPGPVASAFLVQVVCAEEYDTGFCTAYTSSDGGQTLSIDLIDTPPTAPVSEIRVWRINGLPAPEPEPEPEIPAFWTMLVNAREII